MEINRISDLSAFVSSVKYGSFTQAGKHLGLSRSAIGKSIVRLEEQMAVRLLNRTTRSLSLTDDGRILFEYCQQLLQNLDEIDQVMATRRIHPTGTLKITAPHSLGHQYILPVLHQFLKKWSALNADISFTDRFVDIIDEGFDIGIRVGEPKEDSRLLTRTIGWQRMQTCASPEYLALNGYPEQPQDLYKHHTIFFNGSAQRKNWRFKIDHQIWVFDGAEKMKIDSSDAILESAILGFGIIQLPAYLTKKAIDQGKLVAVLEDYALTDEPIRIIYPSKKHLSPRIRMFIDDLVEQWGDLPPWERNE
ncbi:LysR family transcriptional regulator [Acinetobacter sp. R933-2]|uniref:LysR family transcriptional regulator n=1 Tax=Acinetobacter sp. R933-2 TaxID=2746728 RepID=UPI002576984D|nr:LysR family transcriptional regulator [Acinetobacter sp. R933-2]MDM1247731.1 LysR family transcriptional regulator [Acinetobacter sp. R933-2]